MADLNINQVNGLSELLVLTVAYAGNDSPGTGANTLEIGQSKFWHKISTDQLFLVYRLGAADYRSVELT